MPLMWKEFLEQQENSLWANIGAVLEKGEISSDMFKESKNIVANSDPVVLWKKAQLWKELEELYNSDRKFRNRLNNNYLWLPFLPKHNEPLLKRNNIVFYATKKDITAWRIDINKAQRFALESLHDMERTHVGRFMLEQLNKKYQWNDYIFIDMNPGTPTWSKELKTSNEQAVIDWEVQQLETNWDIHRSRWNTWWWAHNWSRITWPFEYARYHYGKNEQYNKDPNKPRIATSPSEVLFHEFWHLFDRFSFVQGYLQQAKKDGVFVDANQNWLDDITENGWKKPFLDAEHTWGMWSQTATYMEQVFILQKKQQWFTDHNPRPKYGTVKWWDVVKRIWVKVNHADQIRPIE